MKRQYLQTAILLLLMWCGTVTKAGAADITIDLSTVANGDTGGGTYGVGSDVINLTGAGNTYILTQSGGTATPTTRTIFVDQSCNVKLRGVNISIANGDVFYVNQEYTVNLTFEGDNTLRTESRSTALANLGTLTLSAVTGEADVLRCIAPAGNGINLKGVFTLTSGTVIAEGGGDLNGIELNSALSGVAINFSGGTVIAKGGTGINDGWDASLTIGDNLNLTAYGTTGSIGNVNSSGALAAKTIQWSYTSAPSTTAETVLVVKNSSGQDVRTFTLPAGYKSFACNLPAGETYTLWLRNGATDTQLQAANGTTAFAVGSEYTGITTAGGTDPGTTDIEIDLSTVTTSGEGYTVTGNLIILSGEGKSYRLFRSGSEPTTYGIKVSASCNIKLDGVNIGMPGGDPFNVAQDATVNLTFEGDNTLRTEGENSALAAVGIVTLSAVNGDADTLRCIAPMGNGIIIKKNFTLVSGTVYAEGGGTYNGMQVSPAFGDTANFSGGTVVAKGVYGINVSVAANVTMGDNFDLTAYGTTGGITTNGNISTPLVTKTLRWSYASAPSTTAETVLVVKNSSEQDVRTLTLPAGYKSFAANLPAGDYTLWLRDGATDTQLQAADGTTAFAVGYEYTGLTTVGGTDPGTTDIELDLSTVNEGIYVQEGGYVVTSDQITLSGEGKSYVFTQSGATPTVRAISVETSCTVKLSGVNISVTGKDAFKVIENRIVPLTFEGDNTLNVTTGNSAIYNAGSLTLSAVNGEADILRCLAPSGTGINLKGSLTLNSGTVYAEGGGAYNGIEMSASSVGTVNFSDGTLFAKGVYGINNDDVYTTVTMGEGFSLTAYGSSRGINAFLSKDPLLARTIRWKYDNAPSTTDETVLVVKDSTGKVVRTFNLPAGYKGFACTMPTGDYTLWLRDMAAKTDTQMQDGSGTTAFAVGSAYEGLTLTDVTQSFATTPMVAYTTAAGEQTPIDFTDLYRDTALGLLKDAVTLHISGKWDQWRVEALRTAIANNGTPALGSNATLTAVTFDADVVMAHLRYLFKNCTALTSVTLPTVENPDGVSLSSTFSGCTALKSVDLSKVTNISNMNGIFRSCTALESVKMPTAKNTNPVDFGNAFIGCPALKSVDLSAFANISSMLYVFTDSPVLESVTMPTEPNATAVSFEGAFRGCPALKGTVDLSGFTNISTLMSTFNGCPSLTGVKLSGAVPANTGATFDNVSPNCLVYVPAGWTTKPSDWNIIFLPGGTTDGDVTLTDEKPFRCPTAFTIGASHTMSYTRTLTQKQWATLCLPFAAALPADCIAKELESSAGETVTFAKVQTLEANKPYIVAYLGSNPTQDVTFTSAPGATIAATPAALETEPVNASYKMAGTYEDIQDRSMYLLGVNSFLLYNHGNLHPFRAYITAAGSAPNQAPSLTIEDENGATGIGCFELPSAEAAAIPAISHVYTVDGRLVKTVPAEEYATLKQGLARGIYIVNGQKVTVTE